MSPFDPAAYQWPEEYAEATRRWQACGHTCQCEELCASGESKAERIKDERGSSVLIPLLVMAITVAPLGCARWIGLDWAGGLVALFAFVSLPVLMVTAPKGERPRPEVRDERA